MGYNYRVQKSILLFMIIALLISGCGVNLAAPERPTTTPFIITSTLVTTPTSSPSQTPPPPPPSPTTIPIEGTTSTQLNVRGEPSTASAPLGIIGASTKVQVIGKDPSGNWYQIQYGPAAGDHGWVTAQYVDVKDKDSIPVIGGNQSPGSQLTGVVIQQVNVRSGAGTDSDVLGTLNPRDVVTLTGKDADTGWLQIEFAAGPDGKGWVAAAYVQADGLDTLPIVGGTGQVLGTATPTGVPPTSTATLVAALQDNDSAASPAADITFSPLGAGSLIYSSDVSSPNGDAEDWLEFTPYGNAVTASLTCDGNGKLDTELWQNGAALQNWGGLTCGKTGPLKLSPGQSYLLRIFAIPATTGLEYVHYALRVESKP